MNILPIVEDTGTAYNTHKNMAEMMGNLINHHNVTVVANAELIKIINAIDKAALTGYMYIDYKLSKAALDPAIIEVIEEELNNGNFELEEITSNNYDFIGWTIYWNADRPGS